MTDGNKESAKELISTFRSLFAIASSGLFFVVTLHSRHQLIITNNFILWIGISSCIISILAMMYSFFLAIPKLFREEQDIIEQSDIKNTSFFALGSFFFAYLTVAASLLF